MEMAWDSNLKYPSLRSQYYIAICCFWSSFGILQVLSRRKLDNIESRDNTTLTNIYSLFANMRHFTSALLAVALSYQCYSANGYGENIPGLNVENGKLMAGGREARFIGINYFDAFTRMLSYARERESSEIRETSYQEGFQILAESGIPFVRFNCGGFYPVDWKLYLENPQAYFQLLDEFVVQAQKNKLGLIPSLFWSFFTVPNIVDEPLSAWGNPQSKTIAFMRKYTAEVVGRYKNSPAIWGWEFGNEYSLDADIPRENWTVAKWYESRYGMPDKPRPGDSLTSEDVRSAFREFAKAVRAIDGHRAIFTGDATPRSSAYHLQKTGAWGKDSRDQWIEALKASNPDPIDTLSIHFYPFHEGGGTGLAGKPFVETLEACLEASRKSGKPLWVGEFAGDDIPDVEKREQQFRQVLDLLVREKVPLSAVWVFDLPAQPHNNIAKDRREKLRMLAEANRKLQESLK